MIGLFSTKMQKQFSRESVFFSANPVEAIGQQHAKMKMNVDINLKPHNLCTNLQRIVTLNIKLKTRNVFI